MTELMTALYDSREKVKNVVDDLRATGIPNDKIRIHDQKPQVQVMLGESIEPEIEEILQRHRPLDLRRKKSAAQTGTGPGQIACLHGQPWTPAGSRAPDLPTRCRAEAQTRRPRSSLLGHGGLDCLAREPGLEDPVDQPAPFGHLHHVAEVGLDCRYARRGAPQGSRVLPLPGLYAHLRLDRLPQALRALPRRHPCPFQSKTTPLSETHARPRW